MRLVALAVFMLALAGCFGGDDSESDGGDRTETSTTGPGTTTSTSTSTSTGGPTPPPTTRVPMLLSFSFEDCVGAEAVYHPDVATAQAALPDGYTAYGEAPAPGADEQASVQYLWTRCTTFSTPSTSLNGTVYGHVAVRIEAPGNVSADTHWYRLRMLADEGIMRQLWLAAQYDVYAGTYNQSVQGVGPLQTRGESLGEYSIEGLNAGPDASVTGSVAYYAASPSGTLEWTGSIDATRSQAAATFSVPSGDPFSAAMGEGAPPVTDIWFHDGSSFSDNDLWLVRSG